MIFTAVIYIVILHLTTVFQKEIGSVSIAKIEEIKTDGDQILIIKRFFLRITKKRNNFNYSQKKMKAQTKEYQQGQDRE